MVERIRPKIKQAPSNPVGRPSQYNAKIYPRTWSLVLRDSSLVLHRNVNFIPKKRVVQRIGFQHYCWIVHHPFCRALLLFFGVIGGHVVGCNLNARTYAANFFE
jgi:hypothetical protein